jgi:hypothetical protein
MGEDLCPITFDELNYPFISFKNEKIFRYYSLDGILDYYNKVKDYRDPITKKNLTNDKISEINKIAKFYKKKQLTIKTSRRSVPVQRRTELLTILCCLNDVVNNIMSTENLTPNYIYNYAIPQIMTYLYYLILRCRNQTRGVMQHFLDILETHQDPNKYNIINYLVGILLIEEL